MPTPLMPDEELDALFRRGLEHYPEQPQTPAAWHRMDLLLDADLRQQALRRKVLRMLGAESVLLVLLLWAAWVFVPAQMAADHGPATAKLNQAPGTDHGPATAGQSRSAAANSVSAATAAQGSLTSKNTTAARLAPDVAAASKPIGGPAAQSAVATRVPLASNASHNTATSGQSQPNSQQQLLATTSTEHRKHTGRYAKKGYLPATNELADNDKSQLTATGTLVAKAVRRGYSLPLTTTRRPAKRLVRRPRHDRKNTAATAYSAANAAMGTNRSQHSAGGRHARQWPTAEGSGSSLTATARTGQKAGAAGYGTVIDLLALRWPVAEFSFALPDSLRPVALAARPIISDSLTPPLLRPQHYRLQLGLVAAPELSAVRTNRLSAPGPSVGVQLDYRLARRWHLSTALLYSVKRYDAAGTDYTVPYALPHGWVIRDVDAVCRIIDIPLNLRYDLWQQPRYQVFASAGLSSLFMKREQYIYNYDPVYGRPVPSYALEVDNGSRHLLKVLNLSAGYERLLSPRWSVQAEAFAKLPLAGVGYGAVRLRSAGVFFSLRYGLLPVRPAPVPSLR